MPNPLKLANFWRILRDVDLTSVRTAARTRFSLLIVSETGTDAVRIRALLSKGLAAPHPWIACAAAQDAESLPFQHAFAGVIVSREPDLSPLLHQAAHRITEAGAPLLTIVIGDTSSHAAVIRAGERSRLTSAALDDAAAERLAAALVDHVGEDRRIALAAQLPLLRPSVFRRTIDETARANASFALTTGLAETIPGLSAPLNLGDMVVLTKNQLMMCYRIALAAGRDGEPRAMMSEIVGVLGGGVLFRQAARSLVGLIPIVGVVPKVAIAYAGTHAIGRAMVLWTVEGRQVTSDLVARYSRESLERGRALAERLTGETDVADSTTRLQRLRRYLPGTGRRQGS
jgi:uncharacterized protein (DUF697 family)